jgi:Zn-dependent protease
MFFQYLSNPLLFVVMFLAIVIAIAVHEFAHAYMADRLGDPTPRLQNRITLNPLAHLDIVGTIMLLLVGFGWGKPVQFDPFNLKNPRKDAAIISLVGPLSNFVMAIIGSILLSIVILPQNPLLSILPTFVANMLLAFLTSFISINITLGVFNLVPIHPLDGFKIIGGFLPENQAQQWYQLERYGFIFLIILLLPIAGGNSPMTLLIGPPIDFLQSILLPTLGGS